MGGLRLVSWPRGISPRPHFTPNLRKLYSIVPLSANALKPKLVSGPCSPLWVPASVPDLGVLYVLPGCIRDKVFNTFSSILSCQWGDWQGTWSTVSGNSKLLTMSHASSTSPLASAAHSLLRAEAKNRWVLSCHCDFRFNPFSTCSVFLLANSYTFLKTQNKHPSLAKPSLPLTC